MTYTEAILKAMDLVKSLRDGSFNKKVAETLSHVSPESWENHYQGLLGPSIEPSPSQEELIRFVAENCDKTKSCLYHPMTLCKILGASCNLI